ncbi:MAG: rod shape determining protein RodA [Lysobacterales bacterium]|jgi:rod shape determining protein RodA
MKINNGLKIWIYTIIIIVLGLIALYSASFQNVRVSQKIFYDQLILAGLGLVMMYGIQNIDYKRYYDVAYLFYGINIILLILVLTLGKDALGARRWLAVGGVNFQPSELTKLLLILFLGRYYANSKPILSFNLRNKIYVLWRDLLFPFILTLLSMFLIFKQPDLGTALLMLGIFIAVAFTANVAYQYLIGLFLTGICVMPFAWHFLKSYQKDRLLVFLNPNIDPLGAGYTIIQSKIAIGSGQILGKGWLSGTQNQLNFLPERHTDFIFSVIGEEWGLMGSLLLVLMYFLLINTALDITKQLKDKFGILLVVGIVAIFTLQVIINIGMVMGVFPIVGLTLPLVSYGRSSFLMFIFMIAILLNLSKKRKML